MRPLTDLMSLPSGAWDPLRDLKLLGAGDSPRSSETSSGSDESVDSLVVAARLDTCHLRSSLPRWGRRRSAFQGQRRGSKTQMVRIRERDA